MARVLVYNRPVDAIFMDVNLGVKTNVSILKDYLIRTFILINIVIMFYKS